MSEETMQTNEAFMDITVNKMEEQDKRINELAGQLKNSLQNSGDSQMVKQGIDELRTEIKNILFPTKEMLELSARLKVATNLLVLPAERKVLHHHYIPKIIWIAAGLFLILCITVSGWYMTADKLNVYIASDTKYRYLKLDTASSGLQKYLDLADSLYKSNPDLRQSVLETEEINCKHLEMLQKVGQMEIEATDLKKKVFAK